MTDDDDDLDDERIRLLTMSSGKDVSISKCKIFWDTVLHNSDAKVHI